MLATIIICTHNPHVALLKKVLRAISDQITEYPFEVIVVDNASQNDIEDALSEVGNSLASFQVVKEPRPGLSYARKAGIEHASGSFICFFDDDNVAATDYLQEALRFMQANPAVGIIGPGRVHVRFETPSGGWEEVTDPHLNRLYQGKQLPRLELVHGIRFKEGFPEGTGMCMQRAVADSYAQRVDELATTGRTGKSLESGTDLQIVFCALDQNLCVGRSPALSMGHYITLQKQGNAYYRRLRFGQFVSIPSAFQAYYPELRHEHEMAFRNQRTVIFLLGLVRLFLTLPRRGRVHFNMELGRKLALYCSFAKATGQRPLPAVRFVQKLAGLTHA